MKKIVSLFLFMGLVSAATAQKIVNDANAEKRNVSGFHGIDVATGIKLVLTESTTEDVAVSASTTEWRDKIVTKVENGILKIYYESKMHSANTKKEKKELKAWVSYKTLDRLNANTGAQVEIEGTLKSASLKMNVNTGATVKGKVNIDDMEVDQNTGSVITITGNADKIDLDGDTGSIFKGSDLTANNCSVTASTGAGVYITVQKELNVKANTGGFVKYKGEAGIREIKEIPADQYLKFNNQLTNSHEKIIQPFLFVALATAATAQKVVNDANAEKRNVSGYHAIEVSGGIDLYLSQGDESVAVSANETKFRDRIKTVVENGVLKIFYEQEKKNGVHLDIEWGNRKLKAYVSFKNLDKLGGSGGSDIMVDGSIKVNTLALEVSGGSDFDGKVDITELKVDASGGSDVKISGAVKNLDIDASGGSDLKGYELAADICNLDASGGSDIYITVNKEMSADASGGSDIYYKGNGVIREMKSSGSSSIKRGK